MTDQHPAVAWALQAGFTPAQVDCTTTVALKILDRKCKMLPGEKAAVMVIYQAVREMPSALFDETTHAVIDQALEQITEGTALAWKINELRVYAEAEIPKPVMKAYKAFLRDGLFG